MSDWYKLETAQVLQKFGTSREQGLSDQEAGRRLAESGTNELVETVKNPLAILWDQLTASMVLILIAAAIAAAALGDYKDSIAIMAIVIFNAILGLRQEYKAEKAIAALKRMATPIVKVRRAGRVIEISATELVIGDILLLEAGNVIPADARIVESANLRCQEAALTGESVSVEKNTAQLPDKELTIGDRKNMVYLGTVVSYGRGEAAVTETGMKTELGKIANLIQKVEEGDTPLQKRLDQVGKAVTLGSLVIIALVVILGLVRDGYGWKNIELMAMTGISLVVAVVPEGLAAVVTISLALGAQRMLRRHALIRKLPAVETLGSVTVICSDKTGTLTENKMTVTALQLPGKKEIDMYPHSSHSRRMSKTLQLKPLAQDNPDASLVLLASALCNDVIVEPKADKPGEFSTLGDPTEAALVMAAVRGGFWKNDLAPVFPRVAELAFDSDRKRMTTIHKLSDFKNNDAWSQSLLPLVKWLQARPNITHIAFTKGSVDSLLKISDEVWTEGKPEELRKKWAKKITAENEKLAQNGMRVIGFGFRLFEKKPATKDLANVEDQLVFVGMMAMIDPARHEVKDAVRVCRNAGIRPVMITGDHPLTALNIARGLGIATNDKILTGIELDKLSVEELQIQAEEVSVYARVSPEHKLKIITALQKNGQIVAMTGDGINDAPALKKADIGVAMGINGTDVAKEASSMVLMDDNFATIVAAVEEGRVIYDGARRFIKYLMTCNSGAVWLMLLASFCGMPLPLLPLQILWINLMGDGLTALALGMEKPEKDIMSRQPYHPQESVFSRGMDKHILWAGLLIGLVSFTLAAVCHFSGWDHRHWCTMVFTTFILSRMGHALAIRSGRESLFTVGLFSNKAIVAAVSITFLFQLAFIYLPSFQATFHTIALSRQELLLCVALSSIVFWAVEIEKWLLRAIHPLPPLTKGQ